MIHALIYHGFTLDMPAGLRERSIYHDLANLIDRKFPTQKNLLINGTWLNWDFQRDCESLLTVYTPDNVFIGSMVDPWEMDQWAFNKFDKSQLFFLGNMDSRYHFNFWAPHFLAGAPHYDENQLALDAPSKLYLCYQNKPHAHRQLFTHRLIEQRLIDLGHVTLQGPADRFQYPTLQIRSDPDSPTGDHFEDIGLGDLGTWNRCYLNIVSETAWSNHSHIFVSEKTWKPILGMRPFVILGNPGIYDYLQDNGFDTFRDLFPVVELQASSDINRSVDIIVDLLHSIKKMTSRDMTNQWVALLPRLRYNRDRYKCFAKEQEHRMQHLFDHT